MSLTGSVILDVALLIFIETLLAVGGTIALLFIIAFVWTKIDEFFEKW
mgnify:CR=1 FL=1